MMLILRNRMISRGVLDLIFDNSIPLLLLRISSNGISTVKSKTILVMYHIELSLAKDRFFSSFSNKIISFLSSAPHLIIFKYGSYRETSS